MHTSHCVDLSDMYYLHNSNFIHQGLVYEGSIVTVESENVQAEGKCVHYPPETLLYYHSALQQLLVFVVS